ncbi:MAG: hypothetical protein QXR57_04010 [Metallosphaera sp.]|uniref:Uncharacterized protein n=1 Tax=Metallosphaera cuprina (strain Ar-4) TaxID=1006006 RepID=F4FZ33_METCR|nr:hypothetical protein [Metallosphaera cuprina]AEB95603.1 hypothetical protein Mcup_1500 [Metallosphaera cuprina Ar-4]
MGIGTEELELMNLGVLIIQRRKVSLGNYEIVFYRRRRGNEFVYVVEVSLMGEIKARGLFTEFRNASLYAGTWLKSLM